MGREREKELRRRRHRRDERLKERKRLAIKEAARSRQKVKLTDE